MTPDQEQKVVPPAPEGGLGNREKEAIKEKINPAVGRILAGTVNEAFLDGGNRWKPEVAEQLKNDFIKKSTEDIHYDAVNDISKDQRKEYYKGDTRSFEEKNKEWNSKFWNHIKEEKNDETTREQFKETLGWIGIDVDNEDQDNGLNKGVEKFRDKYVDGKSSKIGEFVKDIAEKCKENEDVNLDKLQERLDLLKNKGILNAFGTEDDIKDLVKDYATAHGAISQKSEDAKEAVANKVVEHASNWVPKNAPERARLDKLHDKHKELAGADQLTEEIVHDEPVREDEWVMPSEPSPQPSPEPPADTEVSAPESQPVEPEGPAAPEATPETPAEQGWEVKLPTEPTIEPQPSPEAPVATEPAQPSPEPQAEQLSEPEIKKPEETATPETPAEQPEATAPEPQQDTTIELEQAAPVQPTEEAPQAENADQQTTEGEEPKFKEGQIIKYVGTEARISKIEGYKPEDKVEIVAPNGSIINATWEKLSKWGEIVAQTDNNNSTPPAQA
jgi:hypothetical protein